MLTWITLFAVMAGTPAAPPGGAFQFMMISSGANRPGLPLGSSPYREILVALHARRPPAELSRETGIARDSIERSIGRLEREGLLRRSGAAAFPTCMVVTVEEGRKLQALAGEMAGEALEFLRPAARAAREAAGGISGLRAIPADEAAFFLVSDVMLDNWQIGAVEREWLGAERPLRGGSRYYAALFERESGEREPFGIYGNQVVGVGPGRLLGVYGNRRGSADDLTRVPSAGLATMTGLPDTASRSVLLAGLAEALVAATRDGAASPLPDPLAAGLAELGLVREGRPRVAVFDTADARRLSELSASVREGLVARLASLDPELRRAWEGSTWREEIGFEEFRIWWYHFFYTDLTDRLADEGLLRVPSTGLFHYVLMR